MNIKGKLSHSFFNRIHQQITFIRCRIQHNIRWLLIPFGVWADTITRNPFVISSLTIVREKFLSHRQISAMSPTSCVICVCSHRREWMKSSRNYSIHIWNPLFVNGIKIKKKLTKAFMRVMCCFSISHGWKRKALKPHYVIISAAAAVLLTARVQVRNERRKKENQFLTELSACLRPLDVPLVGFDRVR